MNLTKIKEIVDLERQKDVFRDLDIEMISLKA